MIKAAKREQKAAYESAFPDRPPEWLARCKEDHDTSHKDGEPAGTSIFPLNCTSLTEGILLYIRCVLKDGILHFQEVKKNEKRLAGIMDKPSFASSHFVCVCARRRRLSRRDLRGDDHSYPGDEQ